MKCSFCEGLLTCKSCGHTYRPRSREAHQAAYQPDMMLFCPECQARLICKSCGFAYGQQDEADEVEA